MTTHATPVRPGDPIGVFDSGVGGLSVLRALRAELPHEAFVYVADSGHAPYGERDDTHIIARSHAITRFLLDRHRIKALVVACNTATAAAIKLLRQDYPDLPIVGIEPALKPAAASSQTKTVGVMATRGTLGSEKFRNLLASLQGQAKFVLQPCDGLADAIERADATKIEAACAQYTLALGPFGSQAGQIDTVVLGCTHYPFVADVLRRSIGSHVALIEGGAQVARQTRRLLHERGTLQDAPLDTGITATGAANAAHTDTDAAFTFFTTGQPLALRSAVQRWLHLEVPVQTVEIAAAL